jgi:4-alpha-glucanotransferase
VLKGRFYWIGIGDLGPIAYRWVETLAVMKQSWWQVLPLGPTGAGDNQVSWAHPGSASLSGSQHRTVVDLDPPATTGSMPPFS